MTFLEHKLTDHIEAELFTETTSDRVKKLPNGDKRTDFSISGETPYGVDKLKEAMKHDPWFGGDYHVKDMLDSKRKASIINKYVKTNDHLIIMGDMEDHDDPDIDVVKDFVKRIVCKNKYLVIGNNDSFPLEDYKEMGISCVTDIFQYKNYTLSHFPLEVKDGDCCIHAHLHGAANEDQKGADAYWYCDGAKCYDVWSDNFIPIRLSTIEKEFYHTAMESVMTPAITKPWKDYYRVTYEGEGIYEAVRKRVGMGTWKMLLKNTNINWLPKPPEYYSGYMSFFTEHGYEIFQKTSLPILSSYLTKSKIKLEKTDKPGYVMYQDEYQVVTTNDTGIRLLNIVKFNEKLNGMKYQIRNKEYYMKDIDSEDFDKCYRVLSPHDFIKYGGGVCWDYVIYQEFYFDNFFPGTEIHTFYHQTIHEDNNDCPSHTFMLFTIDKRWFWFESSWKDHMGVWEFISLDEAISYISDELIKYAKMEPGISRYKDEFIVEYKALTPESYGQTCVEFMTHKFSIPQYKYRKKHGVKPIKRYLNKDQYRQINGNRPIMESGSNITSDAPVPKAVKLYHGSPLQGLKVINAFAGHKPEWFTEEERVFASPEKAFAACYGARWHDGIAHQGTFDGVLYYAPTDEVDMNNPCSLYEIVNDGTFVMRGHHECYTTHPVRVKKEIKFSSFSDMLKEFNVNIIPYEEYEKRRKKCRLLPQHINESGNYEKKDINNEVIKTYKNDFKPLSHCRVNGNTHGILLLDDGKPVGFYNSEKKEDGIWLQAIEVTKSYQGKGLGKRLMDTALDIDNISKLAVRKSNAAAINLYKKYGFHVEKETENHYIMTTEEVMEESVIFSKKNIELNMNLWKMNRAKVLYITGLSGGGKTTLSKTYASNDVEVIEFDALTTSLIRGINTLKHPELIHPLIVEYLNTIKYTTTIKWSDGGVLESHCRAFVEFLEKRAKEGNKRYVLEGTQIYSYIPASYFRDKPLIILGVSLLRSLKQRTSRSMGKEDKLMEKLATFLHELGLIPLLYKNEKKKKDFENDIDEVFSESVLFKRDNLYFNTKTLKPGTDNNIVFITGFPGAGKTTTLQQIQNKFPYMEGISLDFLTVSLVKKKRANDWREWLDKKPEVSGFIKGYLDKNYDRVKLLNNDFNDPRLIPVYLDFVNYVKMELMKPEYKNYIAVIEGTQLFSIFVEDPNYFDDKAFILIGTSLLTAFCRKIKRDVITDKNYTWENIKRQLGMIPVYKGYNKILEKIYKKYDEENDGGSFLNYMNQ